MNINTISLVRALACCFLILPATAQEKVAEATAALVLREQAQSYSEDDQSSKAVATLAEAARLFPKDRVIGSLLYSALRDHVWHTPQILPVQHKGPVRALAFNNAGTRLASGSDYGEVYVFSTESLDTKAAAEQRLLLSHESDIVGLAFTKDDRRLAVVSRGAALSVWDLASAKLVFEGPRPIKGVTAFAVARNGWVAVGTGSGEIQVLDPAAGKLVTKFQHPGGRVRALAFSRNSRRLVAGAERTALVWNLENGRPMGRGISHAGKILTADFSYDDRYVITGGEDQIAKLSEPESGALAVPPMNCEAEVRKVSISPDGSLLATLLDDSSVIFWDAFTGKKLAFDLREDPPLNDFVWTRSGLRSATVSEGGHATLWTMQNGTRRGELMPHVGAVFAAALTADSKLLATGCLDGKARIWRTDGGLPLPTVRAHTLRARTAFYSLDGKHLITASEDHTALHWRSGEVRPFGPALKHAGKVTCAVFDQTAKLILTCDETGIAQLWDAATGQANGVPFKHQAAAQWVDFHPDGERLVVAAGASAYIWNLNRRGAPLATITHPGAAKSEIKCARFSPNGKWLATASTDGTARLWNATTYQPVGAPIERGSPMLCVRFSPDSSRLVVAGEDAQAVVYDTATWKPVGIPIVTPGPVFSAALTEDNQFLVLSSLLLDAVQFEISSGRPLGQGLAIPTQATCVDFHLLDKVVVVACDDGTVRAVDSPFVVEDVPPWLSNFAEEMVGLKKTGLEDFAPIESQMGRLRTYVSKDPPANEPDFARLARWKLTAGSQRNGMPRFVSTLAMNIDRRVEERSVDALFECYESVSGESLILGALSLYLPNPRQGEFIADLVLGMEDVTPLARCFAAGTLINAGRSSDAEKVLAKALQDAPEDARVLRRVAKLDARLSRTAEAMELFQKAVRIEPNDFETRRAYAWALYHFRRPAEAAEQFLRAQDLGGEMIDDLIAGLCLCASAQGNQEAARAAFGRLLALDPAWKDAAYISALRGWSQQELAELERIRRAVVPK